MIWQHYAITRQHGRALKVLLKNEEQVAENRLTRRWSKTKEQMPHEEGVIQSLVAEGRAWPLDFRRTMELRQTEASPAVYTHKAAEPQEETMLISAVLSPEPELRSQYPRNFFEENMPEEAAACSHDEGCETVEIDSLKTFQLALDRISDLTLSRNLRIVEAQRLVDYFELELELSKNLAWSLHKKRPSLFWGMRWILVRQGQIADSFEHLLKLMTNGKVGLAQMSEFRELLAEQFLGFQKVFSDLALMADQPEKVPWAQIKAVHRDANQIRLNMNSIRRARFWELAPQSRAAAACEAVFDGIDVDAQFFTGGWKASYP